MRATQVTLLHSHKRITRRRGGHGGWARLRDLRVSAWVLSTVRKTHLGGPHSRAM